MHKTEMRTKNKRIVWCATLFGAMMLTACAQTYEDETVEALSMEEEQEVPAEIVGALPDDAQLIDVVEEVEEEEIMNRETVKIYFSNESADGLKEEFVTMDELSPEEIIRCLSGKNIVSIDTKVNDFAVESMDGKDFIRIDLNKSFGEYLSTMGTSGEQVIMAALVNTLLEAYGAQAVTITVEGKVLESGHAIYEEALTYISMEKNEA